MTRDGGRQVSEWEELSKGKNVTLNCSFIGSNRNAISSTKNTSLHLRMVTIEHTTSSQLNHIHMYLYKNEGSVEILQDTKTPSTMKENT